jgi:ribulose-5-phosphate 4-epimerase/fuculose-1-phosphate aldolase
MSAQSQKWKVSSELLHLFQTIGRASLAYDLQDSHCGNMAVRHVNDRGEDEIVITSSGSQKGELDASQLCCLPLVGTDYGYYKASSETDIHARILSLPGVRASFHAHTKELTIVTLDNAPRPGQPSSFRPVDPLGYYHLGGYIPIDRFDVPSGSPEMTKIIPERLAQHPLTSIFAHGSFAKGSTLQEAFFRLCVGNNAGAIVRNMDRWRVNVEALRQRIAADPTACFTCAPPAYSTGDDSRCDFPEEEEIHLEFIKAGHRIFESRLSPFHTGSASVRGVDTILYAPKASMPRGIGGPLLRLPLEPCSSDDAELKTHKAIYAASNFQTIMHCHVPEAEAAAHFIYPGDSEPANKIIPIDAEGSFRHLVIPILPARFAWDEFIRLLHDYQMVVVRGGGVWAVGGQSLSEALHHPSSLREICIYRLAAFERGLDLRKMEPEKAKRW